MENAWSFWGTDCLFCPGRGRLAAPDSFAVRAPRSWCCMTATTGPHGGSLGRRVDTNNDMLEKWEKFFRDPTFWWDNRFNKRNKYFPDFKHVSTGESLWIADSKTPTCVSAKLESLVDPAIGKATTARYKFPHATPVAGDNPVSLGRQIRSSAESRCLAFGKQAHEAVLKNDEHKTNVYLLNGLIDMYCKCGELDEARSIFGSMRTRSVVSYTAIINGCNSNGQAELALEYYFALRVDSTIQPDDRIYVAVISACSTLASESSKKMERALRIGMEIHSILRLEKKQLDLFVANCLVDMYCKCGELEEARKIFDSMGTRSVVSYNAIIQGCGSNGQAELALEYYSAMRAGNTIQPDDRTHVAVIGACSTLATESSENRERALRIGMEIHSMLLPQKKQLNLFVANSLVDMYCKCGELEEARSIFDAMGTRSVVSYTAIIQGCASNGQPELALEYYSALRADTTIQPDDRTHVAVISACSTLVNESSEKGERALRIGIEIHSMLMKEKKQLDLYVATCLVNMYCKGGELEEARKIFDSLGTRCTVFYTAIINGCNSNGQAELALEYYSALRADTTIQPDDRTHVAVMSACSTLATESSEKRERALRMGMEIHSMLRKEKKQLDLSVANCLVDMFCKCGELEEARSIFDSMRTRSVVSYTAIINGCNSNGQADLALEYYSTLRANATIQPDDRTYVAVISACSTLATESSEKRERALRIGMEIHSMLRKEKKQLDLFMATCMVNMYCKCGELEEARKIFDSMGTRSVVSYTAIINGCNWNGQAELALEYYSAMSADTTIQPDDQTHVAVINACSTLATESSEKKERALRIGMEIHSMLRKEKKHLDLFVGTCLVDMYCKCGELEEACSIFDFMGTRSVVSFTAIIQGCGSNGQAELALEYYTALRADTTIQPNDRTHVAVISACCTLATESSEKRERALRMGMEIHSMLSKEKKQLDLFVATCLVDMYCKCGKLEEARKIFDSMGTRDSVSYNAIMNGCNSNGHAEIALEYYSALKADNTIQPDACTYTCVLVACGCVMGIKLGREIHQLASRKGLLKNDPVLASSLVSFYGKCGDVASAQEAFDECRDLDDTGLWTSLIQAYTLQGRSIEALKRFYSMTQEEGCKADDVTFVTVLNACSHGGLVEEGRQLLDEMPKQYGVKPRLEHYVCLIDMLGRANQLDEAVRVLRAMPFEADAVVWSSLLGACRKWKNYTIGKLAFERLVEMDPKSDTPYVLMASIFGNLGMLSEKDAVVERMIVESSIRKAGRSWWTDAKCIL